MSSVRLGTWNLLHGIPIASMASGSRDAASGRSSAAPQVAGRPEAADGFNDPDDAARSAWTTHAMARAAADIACDVVALQEVDRNSPRSGGLCHTTELARAMSADSAFCPTLRGVPGEAWEPSTGLGDPHEGPLYGIGLVSALPVRRWHCRELPRSTGRLPLPVPSSRGPRLMWVSDEPRWALAAEVDTGHGPITVVTTHLSFIPGVNLRQLRALTRWAETLPGPVFLLGDLNVPYRLARAQSRWHFLAAHPTFPLVQPRVQFDHIAVLRPSTATAHGTATHALDMGDHRALTATITVR